MQDKAIICVGNRLHEADALGGKVYDRLIALDLSPEGTAIIDGGLRGIDLLCEIENRRRVVFVDALDEQAFGKAVTVLEREKVAEFATSYGHGAGLPYLFKLLPKLCTGAMPEILLVGAGGPASSQMVQNVVKRCLELVDHGHP